MSATPRAFSIAALLVVACVGTASPAAAQTPSHVRVVTESARVLRWLATEEVLLYASQGTTLEVLDREEDWYWVVLPRNAHGTRKVGWIHTVHVEPFTPPPSTPKRDARFEPPAPAQVAPPANVAPAPPTADDKVTITESRGVTVSSANPGGVTKPYIFDDVHFERDRFVLMPNDMPALRAVVTALKADPSLVIDVEGHTCNLGSTAHNLELGIRRANAVKDYLVSEGIAAARLHTISLGETQPKHDNSREETRRLNRRATLVPTGARD